MTKQQLSLLGLLLALTAQTACAEHILLDEIIVRADRESPKEESLSVREVRESPARDMGEALKQVEGINTVHKGAIANDVVLRGFQKDNINVLVDGVRLHGACPSRMDPPSFHYDFAEIEQVKIIKGPYDLTNPGSLGGLIDAQTQRPGKGFGGELSLGYGDWHGTNASATASYGTDSYDGLLGYAYKYSDVPQSGNGKLLTQIIPQPARTVTRALPLIQRPTKSTPVGVNLALNLPPTHEPRSAIPIRMRIMCCTPT
jgi:iron complex outermembrane receptor protein